MMDYKILSVIILAILCVLTTSCSNSNDAKNALNSMGFTNIQTTGYSWFSCGKDDFYSTGFIAINSKGQKVKGTVCSGFLFKNSTVRF